MKIATTTEDFGAYLATDAERVRVLHECGFDCIDLSMYAASTMAAWMTDGWRERAEELRALGVELGVSFVQAHAPNTNPLDETKFEAEFAATVRSIEVCGALGIPNIVYHAGWEIGISREEFLARNRAFAQKLLPVLEKTGVTLCVENTTKRHYEGYYYFYDGESMRDFCEQVGHPLFAACWDTGHANIDGGQYEHIMALGKHLKALHVNDNLGKCDQHLHPFMGTLNIDEVMHALLDVGYQGYFTFESCSSAIRHDNWLHPRRTFAADPRALDPSFAVARKLCELTHVIGEDILSRYHCLD